MTEISYSGLSRGQELRLRTYPTAATTTTLLLHGGPPQMKDDTGVHGAPLHGPRNAHSYVRRVLFRPTAALADGGDGDRPVLPATGQAATLYWQPLADSCKMPFRQDSQGRLSGRGDHRIQLTMLAVALSAHCRLPTSRPAPGKGRRRPVVSQVESRPIPAAVSLTASPAPAVPPPPRTKRPLHLSAIADSSGALRFGELMPGGTYRLEIRAVGYAEAHGGCVLLRRPQLDHAFDLERNRAPQTRMVEGERGRPVGRLVDFRASRRRWGTSSPRRISTD